MDCARLLYWCCWMQVGCLISSLNWSGGIGNNSQQSLRILPHQSYIIIFMQNICPAHQKPLTVVDLTLHQLICQRCALFDPHFKKHHFIQAHHIQSHAHQLCSQLEGQLKQLKMQTGQEKIHWEPIDQISGLRIQDQRKSINSQFDMMVEEIQRQRRIKLEELASAVNKIKVVFTQKVDHKVMASFQQLQSKHRIIKNELQNHNFLSVSKILSQNNCLSRAKTLRQQLDLIQAEFTMELKFVNIGYSKQQQDTKQKPVEDQLLIEEQNQFLTLDLSFSKTDSLTCNSQPKTQISFVCPSERCSQATPKGQAEKKVASKSQIKQLFIKNNIRTVVLSQLALNNREALDAIKRCCTSTFVSKIDLSCNQLTWQLLVNLKREKSLSKYLKTIVLRGIKMDNKALKKEGISLEGCSNKLQIGSLTIEF